jgi:hypothetical protein
MCPNDSDARYRSASSLLSAIPLAAIWALHGTQHPPPEIAVVPPMRSVFSNSPTDAPCSAAAKAATSPAAPVPRTTTSNRGCWAGAAVTTPRPRRARAPRR